MLIEGAHHLQLCVTECQFAAQKVQQAYPSYGGYEMAGDYQMRTW